jgi:ArsR family transcriptional regulator
MSDLPTLFTAEPVDRDEAEQLAAVCKVLGEPSRLQILSLIIAYPGMYAAEIQTALGRLSQATLSHHLGRLVDAGLLAYEQVGTYIRYTVDRRALGDLADAIRPRRIR